MIHFHNFLSLIFFLSLVFDESAAKPPISWLADTCLVFLLNKVTPLCFLDYPNIGEAGPGYGLPSGSKPTAECKATASPFIVNWLDFVSAEFIDTDSIRTDPPDSSRTLFYSSILREVRAFNYFATLFSSFLIF